MGVENRVDDRMEITRGGGPARRPAAPRGGAAQPPRRSSIPAQTPEARHLLCPNLRIGRPSDLYLERGGGKLLLRATSDVKSRGKGPMELHGSRDGRQRMRVDAAHPPQGRRPARRADPGDAALHRRRRLLRRLLLEGPPARPLRAAAGRREPTAPSAASASAPSSTTVCATSSAPAPAAARRAGPHYPGCDQDPYTDAVTLGTSVGWSDIYPADYDKQWIDVGGLRGCFAFVMTVDPTQPALRVERARQPLTSPGPPPLSRPAGLLRTKIAPMSLYRGDNPSISSRERAPSRRIVHSPLSS